MQEKASCIVGSFVLQLSKVLVGVLLSRRSRGGDTAGDRSSRRRM